ncbi:hypothetical protein [Actinomadura sp. 6N118]|uniref:hypothetical protein n=1 Tax=Actinomadura sp. 6N118 TaxID=3375151 RepID=UPI00379BAB2C
MDLLPAPDGPYPEDVEQARHASRRGGRRASGLQRLVAVQENDDHQPVDVVYLHHIHWKVVFACEIGGDAKEPTVNVPVGSGVVLLGEGVGQVGATPVLDGPGVRPRDEVSKVEHLPDRDQQ